MIQINGSRSPASRLARRSNRGVASPVCLNSLQSATPPHCHPERGGGARKGAKDRRATRVVCHRGAAVSRLLLPPWLWRNRIPVGGKVLPAGLHRLDESDLLCAPPPFDLFLAGDRVMN